MPELLLPDGSPYRLPDKGSTTIGSGHDVELRLTGADLSERHCVIRPLKDGGFGLKDLGSEGGTFVNGRPVRAVRLEHADRITVGKLELGYRTAAGAVDGAPHQGSAAPAPEASPEPAAAEPPAAGAPPSNGDRIANGSVIAGYEVRSVLGKGGMGIVYKAEQLSLHRPVALKILAPDLTADPTFCEGFVSEARAAARFNHPNVVQIIDVDDFEGRPFYTMELLEESLEERLKRQGRLELDEAVAVLRDAARGLAYADGLGLVHRDVKPDNLMLSKDGQTKLCDLGLAASTEASHQGKLAGTPHFMSPEQIRKEALDHRSDLYSLGCTFYRLLTGKTPFRAKSVRDILKAHLETPPPSLREELPELPEAIDAIYLKLMAKDPAERYQHAKELVEDVDAAYAGSVKTSRGLLIGLGLLVVALGVATVVLLNREPEKTIEIVNQGGGDSEKVRAELREQRAENAFLSVSDQGDLLARAAAYEAVAKEYEGTKAGARAATEALRLRGEHQRLEAERLAREEAERLRVQAVEKAVDEALPTKGPVAAYAAALEAAGDEPRPDAVSAVLGDVARRCLEALDTSTAKVLATLEDDLARPDADLVGLRNRVRTELAVPADGWSLPGAAELVETRLGKGLDLIREAVVARNEAERKALAERLAARRTLLVGEGGALAALAAQGPAAAADLLEASKAPEGHEDLWTGIVALARILRASEGSPADLGAVAGEHFSLGAQELALLRVEGDRIVVSGDAGEQVVDPARQPAVYAAFLASRRKGDAERLRQALLFRHGLLRLLPAARSLLHGFENGGPPDKLDVDPRLLDVIVAEPFDDELLRGEGRALRALARLLVGWTQGKDLVTRQAIRELEDEDSGSSIGIALGVSADGD
ncbi:MAG: FHA domain-containing serine/threonine-protein kinase [Planctomycetota bacterium]